MTLLSYEIFQTILDQGSFAKAAEILHLTPSAVSHSIASLEEEVGFPLFIRNKSGVTLTSAGEEISPYLQKIVAGNRALTQVISQMNGMTRGTVKVGCINTVCLTWIPEILKTFRKKYPKIFVEIYQGSYADVLNWTKSGITDLGILSKAACENLTFSPLCRERFLCIAPKNYLPPTLTTMTPEDLIDQPFVIQQESCDIDVIRFLNNYHLTVRANCHVLDDQSALAMVECGAGISIMPELFLKSLKQNNVEIRPIQPEPFRQLGICTGSRDFLSPAARSMVEEIKTYVRQTSEVTAYE